MPRIHRTLHKKVLNEPDNHSNVLIHLELDTLEYEVKWALCSIATDKASGGDGIPVELIHTLKTDAVKVLNWTCLQIWKTQPWSQGWKRSVFIPIPKKGNAKKMLKLQNIFSHFTCYQLQFSSVQSLSHVWLFATPWFAVRQASLSNTNSRSLLKLMFIELVMPSNHLIICCPLLLLPPIPPSVRVFSNELTLRMRRPKYWSFGFSISPSNEHPRLISFRMNWLDVLAVQDSQESSSAPQFKSINSSVLSFFLVQLSHPYTTTGKNIALTRRTFVGKVISLLSNMLSRLVITFLRRSVF